MKKRISGRLLAAVAAAVTVGVLAPAAASANSWGSWYYQQGKTGGGVTSYAHFGTKSDEGVLVGDWDGDGRTSWAIRRGNVYYVSNSASGGATSYSFRFGSASDVVLVGDWNGDGKDTLGVRRGSTYYLSDSTRGGVANRVFKYGSVGDALLVGDWNGDRVDTFAVRRGNTTYFTNRQGGTAQVVRKFGLGSDVVLTGDWNGDGKDTLGVRRGYTYYLTNQVGGGATNVVEKFGTSVDSVFVGDWNGDRVDTLAVRREEGPRKTLAGSGAYVVPSQAPALLYKGTSPADGCYWERVSDFSGDLDSIIANFLGFGMSPIYVKVDPTDAGFGTDSCGTWTEARASDPTKYLTIENGQYRVGFDIEPGRYQAAGGEDCYWERVSDFSGNLDAVLANDLGPTNPIVDVASSDVGFSADSCGAWTRIGDSPALARKMVPSVKVPKPVVQRPDGYANPFANHR